MINIEILQDWINKNILSADTPVNIDRLNIALIDYVTTKCSGVTIEVSGFIWTSCNNIRFLVATILDQINDDKYVISCDLDEVYYNNIKEIKIEKMDDIPGFIILKTDYFVTNNRIYNVRVSTNIDTNVYEKLLDIAKNNPKYLEPYYDIAMYCHDNFDMQFRMTIYKKAKIIRQNRVILYDSDQNSIYDITEYVDELITHHLVNNTTYTFKSKSSSYEGKLNDSSLS